MNEKYCDFCWNRRLSLFWAVLGITACPLLEVQVRPEFFTFLLGEDNISEFFFFFFSKWFASKWINIHTQHRNFPCLYSGWEQQLSKNKRSHSITKKVYQWTLLASTEIREISVLLRFLFVPNILTGITLTVRLLNPSQITEIVDYWVNVFFFLNASQFKYCLCL